MRRRSLPVLALLAALVAWIGLASPLAAAPKAKTCPAGSINLATGKGKLRCAKSGALLPTIKRGANAADGWIAVATDQSLPLALRQRFAPARFRKPTSRPASKAAAKLGAGLAPITAGALAQVTAATRSRADGAFTAGPTTLSNSGSLVTGHTSASSTSGGATTKVDIGMTASAGDPAIGLDLGLTVTDAGGASRGLSLSFPIKVKQAAAEQCPTTDGVIKRSGDFEGQIVRSEKKTGGGLDWLRESTKAKGDVQLDGQVGDDAALTTIAFKGATSLDYNFRLSGLDGAFNVYVTAKVNATMTGTVDAKSGAVNATGGTFDVKITHSLLTTAGEKSAANDLAGSSKFRDQMLKALSNMISDEFTSLKAAEQHWQTPNACATLALSPGSATLSDGQSTAVSGTLKAHDGGSPNGTWALVSVSPGQVDGLPGSSGAGGSIPLTFTGGTPGSDKVSVRATVKATSKAGVAQGDWQAKAPDAKPLHIEMSGDFLYHRSGPASSPFGASLTASFDMQPSGTNSGRAWTSDPVTYTVASYYAPGGPCPWNVTPSQPQTFKANARKNDDGTYAVNVYPTVYLVGKDCVENAAPPEQVLVTSAWQSTTAPNFGVNVPALGSPATRTFTVPFTTDSATVTITATEVR